MNRWDVVVIGGGAAGLAAAGRILAGGRRVLLLEARHRLGGRILTVIDPSSGYPVELGAEFIQGNPQELLHTVRRARLELLKMPERHRRVRKGKREPLPDSEHLVGRLLSHRKESDVAVAELIRARHEHFSSREIQTLILYLEGFHAADLEYFGSAALEENHSAELADADHMFRLAGGYGSLIAHLADVVVRNGGEVHTGTEVTRLRWSPGAVELESLVEGQIARFTASQAVVTVPLPSLKGQVGDPGTLVLDPVPPNWTTALTQLEMGLAHRITLRFEDPWWIKRKVRAPVFVHGGAEPFPVWWTGAPESAHFLTGWVGGPRARALSGKSLDELIRLATQSLSSIFGAPTRAIGSALRSAHSYDWTGDPFAQGAYTYGGIGALPARRILREPVSRTLFLAGEALALGGHNATVPGAILSGWEAAEELVRLPLRES